MIFVYISENKLDLIQVYICNNQAVIKAFLVFSAHKMLLQNYCIIMQKYTVLDGNTIITYNYNILLKNIR